MRSRPGTVVIEEQPDIVVEDKTPDNPPADVDIHLDNDDSDDSGGTTPAPGN